VLSWEADVEAHALREQGWTISAIARHLGHDRKTVRAYLEGRRVPEARVRREPTLAEPFLEYCRLRWPRTRTCGPRPCSTSSRGWASPGRIRR
jgi:transposase